MDYKRKKWIKVNTYVEQNYFLPLLACLAGSETCFLSFRFWSFSRIIFLCCSNPSAFFAFLDNIFNLGKQQNHPYSKTLPLDQGFVAIFNSRKVQALLEKNNTCPLLRYVVQNVVLKQLKEGIIKNSDAMTVKRFFILLLRHVVLKLRIQKDTIFDALSVFFYSVFWGFGFLRPLTLYDLLFI